MTCGFPIPEDEWCDIFHRPIEPLSRPDNKLLGASMRIVLLISFLLFTSSKVWAWGNDGHRIVCAIAQKLLNKTDRNEVERLSRFYKAPDGSSFFRFTEACLFADTARSKAQDGVPGWQGFAKFEKWHFLNLPRSSKAVPGTACADNCVLFGIQTHFDLLRNSTLDRDKAEALLFLAHWVGDIHQPLHISYEDDRGGNFIKPITGGFYPSDHLHAVWDSGIVTKARGQTDWWIYAGILKDRITPAMRKEWLAVPRSRWAQESYDIAITALARYCRWTNNECRRIAGGRSLDMAYQQEFQDHIELRLQKAGVRLASLIRSALHP